MKYKIREESILYSKVKAKERRNRIQTIENGLKTCKEKIAESPTQENLANLESAKTEYEKEYDYIVRGSIIRSRATWFEQGERNSKYFLNLENRNKKKSCIRKFIQTNGDDGKSGIQTYYSTCPFVEDTPSSPKLTDSIRERCEGQLDRRWIKNWRPISLVNVDVKIGSKAIAKRLENVLPHIIHHDQNAFVKGRTIFDASGTISGVMEFTKMRDYQGIMTAIDFEKAFDSLNWNFLLKSLEFFGFGESVLGWIKTFYKNISSCVINNGFSTPSFNLKRGVRQGDPLSPSLFIIVLESSIHTK